MSKIEWTDETWNPVTGCTKVSAGCANCYAERDWARVAGNPKTVYHGRTFNDVACHPERLDQPLRWRKPRRVFVNSMSDLFHEDVPDEFIDRVFATMMLRPRHTFQVLTKRSERMRDYVSGLTHERLVPWAVTGNLYRAQVVGERSYETYREVAPLPLKKVWLGVSVEDQRAADERIPVLLETPAAVRFVSCEPLLGEVRLHQLTEYHDHPSGDPIAGWATVNNCLTGFRATKGGGWTNKDWRLDWVIVGGESGPHARPMDLAWARSLVEQCRDAGVACFVKQLGAHPVLAIEGREAQREVNQPFMGSGWGHLNLKSRKGGDMDEWPEDLRVREMPKEDPTA